MKINRSEKKRSDRGQSVLEYFILTAVVVAATLFATQNGYFISIKDSLNKSFGKALNKTASDPVPEPSWSTPPPAYTPPTEIPDPEPEWPSNLTPSPPPGWSPPVYPPYIPPDLTPSPPPDDWAPPFVPPGGTIIPGSRNNGGWIMAGSEATPAAMAEYAAQGITTVYIIAGYFGSDGNIHTENAADGSYGFPQPDQLLAAVQAAHAAGLTIMPWVTAQRSGLPSVPNLGNPSVRQTMFNQMISFVQTFGFDGFQDDMEEPDYNDVSDYVTYFNGAEQAMQSIGKQYFISICANLPAYMGVDLFSQIKVDRIQMMMYYPNMDYVNFSGWLTFALENASSPLNIAIHSDTGGIYVPLTTAMAWVDEVLGSGVRTDQFAGVDIFWAHGMDPIQWNIWNSWETKNSHIP